MKWRKEKKKDLGSLLCSEELCHYKGFGAFFSLQRKKPLLGFIKLAKAEKKLKEKKNFSSLSLQTILCEICDLFIIAFNG